MKPIILFDIDLTLYDSLHFRQLYPPLMAQALGISLDELRETQTGYLNTLEKSTDFLPEEYLQHIAETHSFPYQKLHDIYYDPGLFKASLYPDTVPALTRLKPDFNLGIFSEGYRNFQITKLKYSGIYDFFDPEYIFIHRRKTDPETLSSLPDNSLIIDDNPVIISLLLINLPIKPIWINRKNNLKNPDIITISSLNDIFNILKSNTELC